MLVTYFKTAFRNLRLNKTFSFLNIFGLAIGLACAGLIFLWVEDEIGFDQFHEKKDRLYFVEENQKYDTYTATFGSTPGVLAPALVTDIPGIANACRLYEEDATLISIGDKNLYTKGIYTDASLFSMFTLPFVQGNAESAFRQLYSLVITEATAKKFFGDQKNVLGKTIRVNNQQDYVISAVIKDLPANSSLQFEFVAPFQIIFDKSPWLHSWGNNALNTYVELKPGVSAASINKLLYNFIQQREPQSNARPFLFSMNDWHLYDQFENGKQTGGGQIEYVRLFATIAWIILVIACINFMNLATARSEKRAREVGVRKVLGAGKKSLVAQFIGESLLMASLAAVAALVMLLLALPLFNTLVQKDLVLNLSKPIHLATLVTLTLICGLVAGSYPSFYLSSFNPVFVLKGLKLKSSRVMLIRKGLVVLQFSISIVLIISTIIIYNQIQHVKSRNLGFVKNNLIEADLQGNVASYFPVLKQDLMNTGMIENVAASDHTTLYGGNNTGGLAWQGKAPGTQVLISGRNVTPEFFQTSGIKLLEGRVFVPSDSVQSSRINVLITQSLATLMGGESAIGKTLWNTGDTSGQVLVVAGVVADYVYGNIYGKPDPVLFTCAAPERTNKLYIRIKEQVGVDRSLAAIERVLKKVNPAYPFKYVFVDDQFNRMFSSEALISKLSRLFAGLAIFISCLGLFGLAANTAERKTKEIGIRKVLGANVLGIAVLLSKNFLQLVGLACLIAFPVAWWMMHGWLQNFQYRITINGWVFLVAGIAALLIALFTISFQAVKAAVANPVKSLRTE